MMDTALMRPGRLERHIYVPPPDDEGRRQIFKVYLKDEEGVLAKDIDLDTLVAETKGFVGADIEALVREAKLYAIRDFISKMGGRSEIEMKDAMENIRVTKEHIRRAQERVKPSLDSDAIESAERQSWEFLYNEEQRQVLEKALNVAKRALLLEKGEEVAAAAEKIRNLVTSGKKQFDVIREQTTELEKQMVEEK